MPESASEVTAAGIARLAGVGRAAVSNWRRRHADFPKPVGGTETSPSFALADVERWLRAQGKLAEVPLRERVWQRIADRPATAADTLVGAGLVLLVVHDSPVTWRELAFRDDERAAELLPTAVEQVLGRRFADDRLEPFLPALRAGRALGPDALPFLRSVGELAAELGPRDAYEFLLGRYLDTNVRHHTATPPGPAALMAAVALPPETARNATVLDPAAGTGGLLTAVEHPAALRAQDSDPGLTVLTALRLALRHDPAVSVSARTGDALRADAYPDVRADAVLCHPPFNERNWGHDELAYDPRWEYGFPARTESELAWVQHALARLRPGGTAVLLMPPAAASRRSGRRIRAGLLRRGALRAVVALPAGAAPPYGIPLHLWVLRRPEQGRPPASELLLVDTADLGGGPGSGGGRDRIDWQTVHTTVLDVWRSFEGTAGTAEAPGPGGSGAGSRTSVDRPGTSRAVPVIELLDDDVDLAPARHVPPAATGGDAEDLARIRTRLTDTLRLTGELTPAPAADGRPAPWPSTTVGELARAGALTIRAGATSAAPGPGSGATRGAVLTDHDVLHGTRPTGVLPDTPDDEPVRVLTGDVIVPVLGGGSVVRVVDDATEGAVLGRNLQLLRPLPEALDPWFLAGFLRGTANTRQASSYASTASRLDVRRLQLPRVPLEDQRRYGERFRALAAFEDALRLAGRLGEQLVQGLYDGLTDGTVEPGREPR
ncbi:N-6 DNA methylase [Streptomyces sp. NPDC020875]|uniref:N-6 DNA methylase n=1 Tax=Streptomyces sp. NPDC020875 TaxID=3154898 RepID=UPI00340DFDB1